MDNNTKSYEFVCFLELAYEFDFSKKKEIETKIKRKLKYYNLGKYNQEIVDYVREFKNDLYKEISQTTKSKYFQTSKSKYADLDDFNIEKMLNDYSEKYSDLEKSDVERMIHYAIYLYYLR